MTTGTCPKCRSTVLLHRRNHELWTHYTNGDWADSTDPARGELCGRSGGQSLEAIFATITSVVAQAAWDRNGAGPHKDSRRENRQDRGASKRQAIHESKEHPMTTRTGWSGQRVVARTGQLSSVDALRVGGLHGTILYVIPNGMYAGDVIVSWDDGSHTIHRLNDLDRELS